LFLPFRQDFGEFYGLFDAYWQQALHFSLRVVWASQGGCFTKHDFPEREMDFIEFNKQKNLFNHFFKFKIPCEFKLSILNELYLLGIHRGFIYPDLDGLSQKIKFEVTAKHKRASNKEQLTHILAKAK
jgi:hypothetical protein